ncbi:MAG: RecQ family ATP-dependent DNA helicase [Treponemataceae bacterium]
MNSLENIFENAEDMDFIASRYFGIKYLFPWQRLVISNIIEASSYEEYIKSENPELSNQIVLLPTGAGKSLCFLVPALLLKGSTLIIYPLLALMNDQQRRIFDAGLDCVIFKGQQSLQERQENFQKIRRGVKLILVNPEVLQDKDLLENLCKSSISHVVIDEAHCVSEWGDSFRPAYLTLGKIIQKINPSVTTAFTATASPSVLTRISEILFCGISHVVAGDFDRPNIHYSVKHVLCKEKQAAILALKEQKPLIIFCSTRSRAEKLALFLWEVLENDSVKFYHAGLLKEEKDDVEKWFYKKTDAILVSTCAFGMGVDKKDIKTVIHLDPPSTVEAYIQEAGRGGRDGSVAQAILLWSPADTKKALTFHKNDRQRVLYNFATTTTCRRQILLTALGAQEVVCSGCDVCNKTAKYSYEELDDLKITCNLPRKTKRVPTAERIKKILNDLSLQNLQEKIFENTDIKQITQFLAENFH